MCAKFCVILILLYAIPCLLIASPSKEDVNLARDLLNQSDDIIINLDSISDKLINCKFDLRNILIQNKNYSNNVDSALKLLNSSKSLEISIDSVFSNIRESMTTMGDFQVYPGILMELFLAMSRLTSSEQQLRFEISEKNNDLLIIRSRFIAILGLCLTMIGLILALFQAGKFMRRNRSKEPTEIKNYHFLFYTILLFTITIATLTFFNLMKVNSNYWSSLIVIVVGVTLAITYQELVYNKKQFRIFYNEYAKSLKPIVGFDFNPNPNPQIRKKHDHSLVLLGEKSPVHAKVLVDINAQIDGSRVHFANKYDGQESWQIMAYGWSRGHFHIEDILQNSNLEQGTNISSIKDDIKNGGPLKNVVLTISIVLRIKRWDQPDDYYEEFPGYDYRYDFIKEKFVANS